MGILDVKNMRLNENIDSVQEAINLAGYLLFENGYVKEEYVEAMMQREATFSTYVGNSVAVPHGILGSNDMVLSSGICFIRTKNPVIWDAKNKVNIIIGIAAIDGNHLDILEKIALVCSDKETIEKLISANSKDEILKIFEEYNE
ncbi:PTS sugar transporter subunit IIA [Vibrio quintilis]|uniref:PTS sugar transporter subunit IIA n=1 Tax=Vibrio quintilis TaxID=1117707 RepID=UPI0021C920F9|nr:PTS sugar transporter subunit IIA [Vibrio quintilis]